MSKVLFSILIAFMLGGVCAKAQTPKETSKDNDDTVIFGSAANPEGGQNMFIVEQPKDMPNPLGNPLPDSQTPPKVFSINNQTNSGNNSDSQNNNSQNNIVEPVTDSPNTAEKLGQEFQNTLIEANKRVYDIQSYPIEDLKVIDNPANPETIYSPNINN